jgi:diguanylate cyclase (GGDEF)-like protein
MAAAANSSVGQKVGKISAGNIWMTDAPQGEQALFLAEHPAGRAEQRFAFTIIVASALIFLGLAPFAKVPLAPLPAFIPLYQAALFINDLITAVFLLGQSRFSRACALTVLAAGYLFTALMAMVHALTFPGLFSPTGLLDAGPQTTAWLYMFWHAGFPIFIIAYACSRADGRQPRQSGAGILIGAGTVVVAVSTFALAAIVEQKLLPPIMHGSGYTSVTIVVVSGVWLLNLAALLLLARRRPYSVLDLWLIVVTCAWLFDIALSAGLNAGRYDLGFYAGRIYGLVAASLVLVVLLTENGKLYLQLVMLRDSDRQKAIELQRLSRVDQLTGIANRRAFDEALDQEWRRMLRHHTALSLLLIDVDYFKRFNDAYGHVAGDQCLHAVAQAMAGRARRAGEMAARYGGEEFAVLLPQIDIEDAIKLAELIARSVRELNIPHKESGAAPQVTVSIGVASAAQLPRYIAVSGRSGAAGAIPLVEAADSALYLAKMAGRNRVAAAGADDVRPAAAA